MFERETDPNVLKQLESSTPSGYERETDPAILSQLEGNDWLKNILSITPQSQIESAILGLGKAGENIATSLTGGRAPKVIEDVKRMINAPDTIYSKGAEMVGQYGPLSVMPGGILAQMATGAVYGALQSPENPIMGGALGVIAPPVFHGVGKTLGGLINMFKSLKGLKPLQENAINAESGYQAAKEAEQQAKELSKKETGHADYATMENKLNKHKSEIENLNNKLEEDVPSPESYLLDTPKELEKRVMNSNLGARQAQNKVSDIENEIGEHLETGASHDVRVAKLMKQKLKQNREEIQEGYNNLEKSYEDKHVVIDNTPKIKQLNNDLIKLVQEGKAESKEAMKLNDEVYKLNEKEFIPAKDFVSAYRSVNGYMRDSFKKGYQTGANEADRSMWLKRANEAKDKLEEMKGIMEENLSPEEFSQFNSLSQRWKNEIVPLYQNKLYRKIIKNVALPKDIIYELRESGPGMDILKNIVKSDPQILKHVVGQRFDKSAKDILNPNELVSEYTQLMPELNKLTNLHKEASDVAQKASEKAKLHKTFSEEANRLNKVYTGKMATKEKMVQEKSDLEKQVSLLEKHIPELRKVSQNKNLSLKEHIAANNRLKRAEIKRDAAKRKLKIIGGIAIAGSFGYGATNYLNKIANLAANTEGLPE